MQNRPRFRPDPSLDEIIRRANAAPPFSSRLPEPPVPPRYVPPKRNNASGAGCLDLIGRVGRDILWCAIGCAISFLINHHWNLDGLIPIIILIIYIAFFIVSLIMLIVSITFFMISRKSKGQKNAKLAQRHPLRLVYASAPEDHSYLDELDKHLTDLIRSGSITTWDERKILPGANREKEIEKNLASANIIMLLVSPDLKRTSYYYGEKMRCIVDCCDAGDIRIIPIILRQVDWDDTPFSHLQMLPRNGQPIADWSNPDKFFDEVFKGIKQVVNDLQGQ